MAVFGHGISDMLVKLDSHLTVALYASFRHFERSADHVLMDKWIHLREYYEKSDKICLISGLSRRLSALLEVKWGALL